MRGCIIFVISFVPKNILYKISPNRATFETFQTSEKLRIFFSPSLSYTSRFHTQSNHPCSLLTSSQIVQILPLGALFCSEIKPLYLYTTSWWGATSYVNGTTSHVYMDEVLCWSHLGGIAGFPSWIRPCHTLNFMCLTKRKHAFEIVNILCIVARWRTLL